MKVLISDKLSQQGKDILKQRGLQFDEKTDLTPEQLKETIGQYDGIIIRSGTKLTKDVLENPGQLKAIARAGVGVDNVDVPTATEKGIVVMNTPGGNTVSTAELTFSMLLALSRKIPHAWDSLRKGEWKRSRFAGVELRNKTLGIMPRLSACESSATIPTSPRSEPSRSAWKWLTSTSSWRNPITYPSTPP